MIELETQNGLLDPTDENIILKVFDKMKKWFGKTKIDEASDAWKSFRDIMRIKEESIDDFLFRFGTADSFLIYSGVAHRMPTPHLLSVHYQA